ncbi:DUF4362 domain-containing protein [Paenibacillus paridis]|uniref:DUF4362 domain-containing protein n=1 Tax=Paenibacillus paridis TaxID=2583376 RepID=UPI001122DEF1|nr:DUF4362 domain-containing protein [Paenibacillus paridis]
MAFSRFIIFAGLVLMLGGCAATSPDNGMGQAAPTANEYVVNEAEDVIAKRGIVQNSEQLDAFISGSLDRVRVVHYTKEADPIFYSLSRIEEQIEVRYDTSQDKFGSPTVKTYRCESLIKEQAKQSYTYKLSGCGGAQKSISLIDVPLSPST